VTIPIVEHADPGIDPDVADGLFGFGTVGTPHLGDIVHAGWMPQAFFDKIFLGGGDIFLAVTFTFDFLDDPAGFDINHDGKFDTSFREIYYNNHFTWGINADPPIADVETVALHEAGHGLSLAHFGKIFIKNESNGNQMNDPGDAEIQFAPFAVMNATIFGQNHVLQGSDVGSFCTVWGDWPTR
jgi:hypothetical protein